MTPSPGTIVRTVHGTGEIIGVEPDPLAGDCVILGLPKARVLIPIKRFKQTLKASAPVESIEKALVILTEPSRRPRSSWCAAWRWRNRYLNGCVTRLAALVRDTRPAARGTEQSDIHKSAITRLVDEVAASLGLTREEAAAKVSQALQAGAAKAVSAAAAA